MSLIRGTFAAWIERRADYDETLYAQYVAAEEAMNGAMMNARGRAKGIYSFSLFMVNEVGMMALFPYLREGFSSATVVIFKQPVHLPIAEREILRFDVEAELEGQDSEVS